MIVEAKDVKFFEVEEVRLSSGPVIRVRGLVFHSSLAVKHVKLHRSGDEVNVEVLLTPATKGLSGSFVVDVPISEKVNKITFGKAGVQIWPK